MGQFGFLTHKGPFWRTYGSNDIRVQMNPEIQLAREIFSSFAMKTLSKQSMGYIASSVNWIKEDGKSVRELLAVDLKEGSAVIFPMNPLSTVDSVKRYWPGYSAPSEAKEGRALSAATPSVLTKAVDGITGHVRDVQQHLAACRAGSLQGFPLYGSSSASETYDIASALAELVESLEGKAGAAISQENHVKIGQATTNIMKHVAIIKNLVDEHQRLRDLTG
jgi:hypothetical protein